MAGYPVGTAISNDTMISIRINMFFFFKFTNTKTRYVIGERELLGIVRNLAECRWLIIKFPFPIMLYIDYLNLLKVFSNDSDVRGKTAQWLERLGEYQFVVQHRPNTSKIIRIADGFSRLTGPTCEFHTREDSEKLPFICSYAVVQPRQGKPVVGNGCPPINPEFIFPFTTNSWQGNVGLSCMTEHEAPWNKLAKPYWSCIWYCDVIRYLLLGPVAIEDMTKNKRRAIIRDVVKYRLVGGFLYRLEKLNSLAECIMPDEVGEVLKWAHDGHGHYAIAVTLYNLMGTFW